MLQDSFFEVLKHEGVVSVTSWANGSAHVANTWNSYLQITQDHRILLPAAWFHQTQKNVEAQSKIIMTLGSHEVQGKMGMGTGFVVEGTAAFLTDGDDFHRMKAAFPFLTRVLEVTPERVKQTI